MKTPISYWGGKQRLASKVLRMFPKHRVYCEPFFGGGVKTEVLTWNYTEEGRQQELMME